MSKTSLPLICIGIPVYNGGEFIGELLQSIKNQTYQFFKCHIVNNSSTDNTQEVIHSIVNDDHRFQAHYYKEFVDINTNWNRIVNHIDKDAKYLKIVQADDILLPDSLGSMVELMEKHPSAGIGTSYRIIGDQVHGFGINYTDGSFHNGKKILLKHLRDQAEITGSITQLFFRIEHLKKVHTYPTIFNPEEYHDDTRLAYEMFLVSDVVFSFKPLNFTRRHKSAETVTTVERHNTLLQGKESRIFRFKEFFPELVPRYIRLRRKYAYFLFKCYLRNKPDTISWHKKFLKRKITVKEMLLGVILENKIAISIAKAINN